MINKIIWTIAIALIFSNAIYFSIVLKFPQLKIKKIIKSCITKNNDIGISPIETLMMSLANKIGVGSLSGISLAIYVGGPGTILWMWVGSFILSINAFLEGILSIIYKEKDVNHYKSGPAFYIKKGLKKNKLSIIYALITLFAYIFCFLSIQTNTMVVLIDGLFTINKELVAIIISLISLVVILKGLKMISSICSILVPIMSLIYIIVGMIIVIININSIIPIIKEIFYQALNHKSFASGALYTLYIGIQKSIFANEAGIGTGAISSGTTSSNNHMQQGYIQVIGIYFITLVIITITAIIVLTSNYQMLNLSNLNGIEITKYAMHYHLGQFGDVILLMVLVLFAFSTIITGYYYGESSLKFIYPNVSSKAILILKLITASMLFIGAISSPKAIWELVNISTGVLAIINIYSIYHLKEKIVKYCSPEP